MLCFIAIGLLIATTIVVSIVLKRRIADYHVKMEACNRADDQLASIRRDYDKCEAAYQERVKGMSLALDIEKRQAEQKLQERLELLEEQYQDAVSDKDAKVEALKAEIESWRQNYQSLIAPFKQIEKDKAERRYNCIALSDEDKADIQYLLSDVAPHMSNRDVIPKLVWSVYVQQPLNEALTHGGIEDKPGIYKLTNIDTNQCYIGKSTNVRKRIIDHFKSVCGISTVSDQMVHHAIFQSGMDNWQIEALTYCGKEELNEKEKFYIATFESQVYGLNIASGG